jgi:SAM-dependent methyltransferase
VEPARRALERCEEFLRELGLEAALVPDFFEDADIRGPFDAIIFSYFCYGYIPVSARRVAVLRKARGLLAPGGRIFVSYVVTARPHRLLPRLANIAAAVTRSDWRLEPGDSISMTFDAGRRACFFFDHAFTTAELLDEIAAAGLDVVHHRTAADYPCVICAAP